MSNIAIIKEPGILREGIMKVLQDKLANHSFEVFSSTQQYLLNTENHMADLLIVDADTTRDISKIIDFYPLLNIKVAAWTSEMENDHLTELFKLGLHGYFYNGMKTSELLFAIKSMLCGRRYIHPHLVPILLKDYLRVTSKNSNRPSVLTEREWDVLEQIAEGKNNENISKNLFISSTTVKNHVRSILGKLDVADRTNAVLLAIKNSWIKI